MTRDNKEHPLGVVVKEMSPLIEKGVTVATVKAMVGSDYKKVLTCIANNGVGGAVTILDPRGNSWAVSVETSEEFEELVCNSLVRAATWYAAREIRDLGGPGAAVFVVGIEAIRLREPEVTFVAVDGSGSKTYRIIRETGNHRLAELVPE